ncbi:hypothetical protein [Cupriavidus taiwanensis]|nr:hypothetical protein [Cupriavidus taiwanensis]
MKPLDEQFTVHPELARLILAAQDEDPPNMTYQEFLEFWGMGGSEQPAEGLAGAGIADPCGESQNDDAAYEEKPSEPDERQ